MARKSRTQVRTGNDELSDVLVQPGADLPLPTDPVRMAEGEIKTSPQEEEYERAHQPPPPPPPFAARYREEGEAAARQASGSPAVEEQRRGSSQEPKSWDI